MVLGIPNKFLGNAAFMLVLRILVAIISYATAVILASLFNETEYGQFATIFSLLSMLGVACGLGVNLSSIKFLGQYQTNSDFGSARGVIWTSEIGVLIVSLIVLIVGTAFIYLMHSIGQINSPLIYTLGLFALPAFAVMAGQNSISRVFGGILNALAPRDIIWRGSQIILAYICVAFLSEETRFISFLIISAALITVLAFAQRKIIFRRLPKSIANASPELRLGEWWQVSKYLWFNTTVRITIKSIDVVIVAAILSVEEAGFYFAASRISSLVGFVLMALNLVLGPEISRQFAAGQSEKLKSTISLSAGVIFVCSMVPFLICIFAGKFVLSIFGDEFIVAYGALVFLALGQMVNVSAGSVGLFLDLTGHERLSSVVLLVVAPITIVAEIIMAHFYGLTGAAMAVGGGLAAWNIALWIAVRRVTEYDPSIFGMVSYIFRKLRERTI